MPCLATLFNRREMPCETFSGIIGSSRCPCHRWTANAGWLACLAFDGPTMGASRRLDDGGV